MKDASMNTKPLFGTTNFICGQLTIDIDANPARVANATKLFFELAMKQLPRPTFERILASTPAENDQRAIGRPAGSIHAMIGTQNRPEGPFEYLPYSPNVWTRLLAYLENLSSHALVEDGLLATLEVGAVDGKGVPDPVQSFNITASCIASNGSSWLLLEASRWSKGDSETGSDLSAVLRPVAELCDPVYGEISWSQGGVEQSVLETVLYIDRRDALPTARSILRGYAWTTVMPEEIAVALGGADVLRASGAFYEVGRLAAGGFWLQATKSMVDFDGRVARMVFDAVKPSLPPGRPTVMTVLPPNVIIDADPANSVPRGSDQGRPGSLSWQQRVCVDFCRPASD